MGRYDKEAKSIIEFVGGENNIKSVHHCMTRLRLVLKDRSKVNEEELNKVEVVKGINDQSGQLQIIIGTGVVNKVYKSVMEQMSPESISSLKQDNKTDFSIQGISRMFGDIFIPILPAIVASGILLGVKAFLIELELLDTSSPWLIFLSVLIDTGFAFLPVLVSWSATKKFGGSVPLGIIMGIMLISPSLPSAPAVAKGITEALFIPLFGLNISITGYQGSILVALIAGWLISVVGKYLEKIVPDLVSMIFTPLLTLTVTFFIIFLGIGPIANLIENAIVTFFEVLFTLPFGIGGFIIGGLQQVLVITGLHHVLWIIDINFLENTGMNLYQPIRNASVLGQMGASLAFVFVMKGKLRATALSASTACLFGITEPAIFGITLPMVRPFVYGMIGSAIGGMFSTMIGLAAPGMGAAGLPGILYFIGDVNRLLLYLLQSIITIAIPFILTYMYLKKNQNELELT